jgi:hypothetical protein
MKSDEEIFEGMSPDIWALLCCSIVLNFESVSEGRGLEPPAVQAMFAK